jgi:UDP-N-acetylmuramoylalanine--D-glutamate ligase
LGGISFVDDSKATNVAAVCAGLTGSQAGVVLIAGGRGKGEDYRPLRQVMGSVRAVVVIGEEGAAIAEALAGVVPVTAAESLEAAVVEATQQARPEGTVLLSPACASFDMFRNYRERGKAFTAAALAMGASEEGAG